MNINSEEKYLGFIQRQHVRYYLAAFVSLITFIVYLKALRNEFVNWDDNYYIVDNPYIRSLDPAFFRWAFLDFYASNWHPLTWISHATDYALWGLNPLGHHLTNIILHSVNTFMVVLLLVNLLEAAGKSGTLPGDFGKRPDFPVSFLNERAKLITAGMTGLLFGIHPLHVESVAWVSERKDLLCGLFFLLSIMMYIRYSFSFPFAGNPPLDTPVEPEYDRNKRVIPRLDRGIQFLNKHYFASLIFFVLALLSKPMAVTLPLVLLILDWCPFKRIGSLKSVRNALMEKIPFFALSLSSSIVTILAQKESIGSFERYPLPARLLVGVKSLISYIWEMIAPMNLIPYYPYPKDVSLLSAEYLLPIVLAAGITMVCVVRAKRQPLWLAVWMYYIVTLIPVLGIVQVGKQAMADRYTYLPSLGLFLVAGLIAEWVATKVNTLAKWRVTVKFFGLILAFSAFATIAYLTSEQIGVWKNSIALWNFVIDKDPGRDPFPYMHRGISYARMGQLDRAAENFDMAYALSGQYTASPGKAEAYNNRGLAFGKTGQLDRAIENFSVAIALNSQYFEAYVNRGAAFGKMGQLDRARKDFDKAIGLNPNSAFPYLNRGNVYLKSGNDELAISDFQKACSLGSKQGCEVLKNVRSR